jgi:hypothetical protein
MISADVGGVQIFEADPLDYVPALKSAIEKYEKEKNATV